MIDSEITEHIPAIFPEKVFHCGATNISLSDHRLNLFSVSISNFYFREKTGS